VSILDRLLADLRRLEPSRREPLREGGEWVGEIADVPALRDARRLRIALKAFKSGRVALAHRLLGVTRPIGNPPFTAEYKADQLAERARLIDGGSSKLAAAEALGIDPKTFRDWEREPAVQTVLVARALAERPAPPLARAEQAQADAAAWAKAHGLEQPQPKAEP